MTDDALGAARTAVLLREAEAAGLIDPDLLKVARPDLMPGAAVAELRAKYPAAFRSEAPVDARTMSRAEIDALGRQLTRSDPAKAGEKAGMRRFWADLKRGMPDLEIPEEYR